MKTHEENIELIIKRNALILHIRVGLEILGSSEKKVKLQEAAQNLTNYLTWRPSLQARSY